MSIEILDLPKKELVGRLKELYKNYDNEIETDLPKTTINSVTNILSTREIKDMILNIQDQEYIRHLSYTALAEIEDASRILFENIKNLKRQVEIDTFFKDGYNINISKLKKEYRIKGLRKQHPKLDFLRIKDLYVKPPRSIPTYYDETKNILIDEFVFRKYMVAIIQMIFNHMDFVVCNIGDEGSGKSCKCTQDMYIVWWIMKEIGLIDYEFKLEEMFVNTLQKFSELEDKYYGKPFRIVGLDEGNELNRQDWKEDQVKLFWQRLRRERHERRIKFINIPVLGEMIINIVLSRINFIFDMKNKNRSETGTLYKGEYNFYIIPRGDKVYSPYHKRELTKEEIKNKLYTNLKDKEYLKGLPADIRIKTCLCNGIWGYKQEEYEKQLKETNKAYTVKQGIRFRLIELYAVYKAKPTHAKHNIEKSSSLYSPFETFMRKLNGFWKNDPELYIKYEQINKHKQEEKDRNARAKRKDKPTKRKSAAPILDTTTTL